MPAWTAIEDVRLPGRALVPLLREHMEPIRLWRNAQVAILRQRRPLSEEDQARYFRDVILPSQEAAEPPIVLATYTLFGQPIGYGGLVHIDWDAMRAEVSFLVEPTRAASPTVYRDDFSAFLTLLQRLAFDTFAMHRIFAETFDVRPLHVAVLEESGFLFEGRMRDHVHIDGAHKDSLIHGKLRTEWTDAR